MNSRKIKDYCHVCFQKLVLKTRVILILNFTRPHAITYTKLHQHICIFKYPLTSRDD